MVPPDDAEMRDEPPEGGGPIIPSVFPPGDPVRARYEDLGPIGRGGMGDVRRVYDRRLERVLAMKILSHALVDDLHSRARFLTEARITAGLQHPGIVAVHDEGELSDGRLWMTMREVRGRTLSAVIAELHRNAADGAWPSEEGGPTLHRVVDSFRRICDAAAYAHSRGVVHRDLKPANLMVGEFGEVQVMDWGLAKHVDRTETRRESAPPTEPSLTQDGDVLGTPSYMSPEQARGELERLGPASDVWALGAVLRKILTGRPPVEGRSPAVLATIIVGEIRPLREVVKAGHPPLPDELVAICERAMAHDPADRHADAGALAREVGAWLEGARRRERAVAIVEEARGLEPGIRELRARAAELRAAADAKLRELPQATPAEEKYAAWDDEDAAAELEREAALREVQWLQQLRGALNVVPDLPEAHARLAEHYRERLLEAEARRDPDGAARAEALLREHDRGEHAAFLAGAGKVTLVTDPPGARVTAYRYVEEHRRLVPERFRDLGESPVVEAELPRGSYLLVAELEGRPPVRYPVLIERGGHWDGVPPGGSEPHPIPIPTAEELGDELVYVPAGWFWSGGDPQAVESLPRRKVWVDGMLVSRHPVTNAEYVEWLDALVDAGQEELALRYAPRRAASRSGEHDAELALGRDEEGHFRLPVDDDGVAWRPDWPVTLVDWHSAVAYARQAAERTARPLRLPNELEWEKLARGTDARFCAWGDHLEPTWACVIGATTGVPRPVSIHDYPTDESPYGVRGTTGNVREWCVNRWRLDGPEVRDGRLVSDDVDESDTSPRAARGGGWHSVAELARAACRFASDPDRRFAVLGFRLVCGYP